MDTDQLVAHSRARFEHAAARRTLKEKYQARLTFAHAGGLWCAGPELINILQACCHYDTEELVLLDLYETPIMIDHKQLAKIVQARWQEQMTAWSVEYEQLNDHR